MSLALLCAAAIAPAAWAQSRTLTGRVYDDATQQGIPGALVSVPGGGPVAQAGQDGRYRIALPTTGVKVLVRGLGYKRREIEVSATQTTLDVALAKEALQLNEVVVTGSATTQERRNVSTAVTTVAGDQVSEAPSASLENALQGKVVGATINMNSGAPGGGGQIQIRGVTSILGNGEPLYVVDGVIFSNAAFSAGINAVTRASGSAATSNQDNAVNRLADLNPDEIENIQILKSAAASAIYGSQATNGVVLITTKRGHGGATQVHLSQRMGTNMADRLLGSRHFQTQADLAAVVGAPDAAKYCPNSPCPYYDYQGQLYGQRALADETALSVNGGTDVTKYFVSVNDKKDPGTMINTGARRQNVRVNVDQSFGNKWTGSASTAIYRSQTARGISNNDNTFTSPIYAFGYTPAVVDLQALGGNGKPIDNLLLRDVLGTGSNPFQTIQAVKDFEDVWRQVGSGQLRFNAWSAANQTLQLSAMGGFDRFDAEGNTYSPNYLQFEPDDGFPGTAVQSEGLVRQYNSSLNAVHTYTPTSNKWLPGITSLTTSAGLQYEDRASNRYSIVARGLLPGVQNIDQGTPTLSQTKSIVRNEALYGSEELLALNDKLSASAHVRAERSSVNGDRNKWFYWPALSAAYRFVDLIPHADEIKLRGSLGISGNQPLYGLRDLVLVSNGIYDGRNAIAVPSTIGNANIEPEKMREQEIGIDGSFFENRVGLEASYYNRTITDMLLTAPLAASSGYGAAGARYINGGTMKTAGVELALNLLPIRNKNFTWTSRTQYYAYQSRVTSLPVADFAVTSSGFGAQYGRGRIAAGYRSTLIWGNKQLSDGTAKDTVLADANPNFQMGFGNDFNFHGLTINTLLDWRKGGYVSDMTNNLFDEGGNSWDYDKASPDANVGKTLGAYRYNLWNAGRNAGEYIHDGSYVKLREVTVSYPIPARFTQRVLPGSHDARLSFSGRNLYTWTKYWSFDPEVNNFGNQNVVRFVDLAPFPPTKSFLFGIDIGY